MSHTVLHPYPTPTTPDRASAARRAARRRATWIVAAGVAAAGVSAVSAVGIHELRSADQANPAVRTGTVPAHRADAQESAHGAGRAVATGIGGHVGLTAVAVPSLPDPAELAHGSGSAVRTAAGGLVATSGR
jgi:hypothetical protein